MKVTVSPELSRLATLANMQIAYLVWCILRDDIRTNDTSGHYSKSDVKSLCASLGYTTRHWSRIFNSGHGFFWGNDKNIIHLRSYKRVAKKLERATGSRIDARDCFKISVIIELSHHCNIQEVSAKLYWSWFLARGEVTIARDTIQAIFGLSHDQQRAYEKLLGDSFSIKHNYCLIDADDFSDNPTKSLPEHHTTFRYERARADESVIQVNAIQYQMPNSFYAKVADNGDSATTTATQSERRVNAIRLRYASCTRKQDRLYFANFPDFERYGTLESYVRTYYNGKRRVYRYGHYL